MVLDSTLDATGKRRHRIARSRHGRVSAADGATVGWYVVP
jgi:hypothetical protein